MIPDLTEAAVEAVREAFATATGKALGPTLARQLLLAALPHCQPPEGYVLAPVDGPTNKMLLRCQTMQAAAGYTPSDAEWLTECYRSMLAALPSSRERAEMNITLADRVAYALDRARRAGYDLHADLSRDAYVTIIKMYDERLGEYPPDDLTRAVRAVRKGLVP